MKDRFIEGCHSVLYYEKKEGTKSSYYQKAGERNILPNRISWGIETRGRKGTRSSIKKCELKGRYKVSEQGLYKDLNERNIHTAIWGNYEYPEFYGYGIIDERFGVYDLLIIYSDNNCNESLEIHLFRQMGKPEFIEMAFRYCRGIINKKPRIGA